MKRLLAFFFTTALIFEGFSNNIAITSVALTGQNTTAGVNNANNFTLVQFNLAWENSHRVSFGPTNWDAAWVFIKYKVAGTANWEHARLNNIGHTAPVGSTVNAGLLTPGIAFNATANSGLGAFIYRSAVGTGTFTANSVQLRWNYGANGLLDNSVIEVQVYAVEMIFVPSAAFNAGGGGGGNTFTSTTINTSVASIIPAGIGLLGGQAGGFPTGQTAPISTFPNGFASFYTMKYEISQQQYVDFLNALSASNATTRFPNSLVSRNGIIVTAGLYSTTNPAVACNFLSWTDFSAYLDWSGLRPMTEMEFEKACRGTSLPVLSEHAWGSAVLTTATGFINGGLANEAVVNAGANSCLGGLTSGPLRVGIFAGNNTTRVLAGSTFYGAMEFSGNLWEMAVTLSSVEGRSYTGFHGDGTLNILGEANVLNWPVSATGLGAGIKGSAWIDGSAVNSGVSDRAFVLQTNIPRARSIGGRGVRTAP